MSKKNTKNGFNFLSYFDQENEINFKANIILYLTLNRNLITINKYLNFIKEDPINAIDFYEQFEDFSDNSLPFSKKYLSVKPSSQPELASFIKAAKQLIITSKKFDKLFNPDYDKSIYDTAISRIEKISNFDSIKFTNELQEVLNILNSLNTASEMQNIYKLLNDNWSEECKSASLAFFTSSEKMFHFDIQDLSDKPTDDFFMATECLENIIKVINSSDFLNDDVFSDDTNDNTDFIELGGGVTISGLDSLVYFLNNGTSAY
jgi:hypothetical protein